MCSSFYFGSLNSSKMGLMISLCVLNPMNHGAALTNTLILYLRIQHAQLDKLKTQTFAKGFKGKL